MARYKDMSSNKTIGVAVVALLLVLGLSLIVNSALIHTMMQNNASGPTPTYPLPQQAITNLNHTEDIVETNNPDGTMGPTTANGNWSNSIPAFLKGTLQFAVTDPIPTDPGSQGQRPTGVGQGNTDITHSAQPTHTVPTQAQGNINSNQSTGDNGQGQNNGPQTVTALNLTISKVEVHIAYHGTPGSEANMTLGAEGRPSITPGQQNGQGQPVDYWETLNIETPFTVDLVQLAKTNDFSTLGLTSLAAGRYTEVRLYVKSATAMFANNEITVPLTILGHDNIVKIVRSFTIVAGQTTKLAMDFDAQHSVINANGQYLLKPVVARLIEEH